MNILLTILLIIVILVTLLLITALFTKKEYTVERETTINKPRQEIFDYVKLIKNQDYYNVWVMMDPNSKRNYKGTDGTVGFEYTWDSTNKRVGKGEQTIKAIKEGERIESGIHFIKPFEGKAVALMTTELVTEKQTKVKWTFNSGMKYPMNAMLLFMNMNKMLGTALQESLVNLKTVLEK